MQQTTFNHSGRQNSGRQKGFTLIEVMIVVAIIGILAAIAYPSYAEYMKKGRRTEAKSEMQQIAQRLSNYALRNGSTAGATLTGIGAAATYPATSPYYTFNLSGNGSGGALESSGTWVLSATPSGVQVGDGTIRLNSDGQKCWVKGQTTCTLGNSWD